MKFGHPPAHEHGQGLLEYALILVLAVLVITAALVLLGPTVSNAYRSVVSGVQQSTTQPSSTGLPTPGPTPTSQPNVIVSVAAARTGNGNGNTVMVTVVVSVSTAVTVVDSQQAAAVQNVPCNGSCVIPLGGVGFNSGTVTVTAAAGGMRSASYPAKLTL